MKTPTWDQPRGENLLDGGCPWYEVYGCAGGGYMAVGALEPQFFAELVNGLGLEVSQTYNRSKWPSIKRTFQRRFLQKTRQQWEEVFLGKDACCTPVLTQAELEKQCYDQRPAVNLGRSPGIAIRENNAWNSAGLSPGSGGEKVLHTWMGWRKGKHYDLEDGGLVHIAYPKL